jgi:hypothetical protein
MRIYDLVSYGLEARGCEIVSVTRGEGEMTLNVKNYVGGEFDVTFTDLGYGLSETEQIKLRIIPDAFWMSPHDLADWHRKREEKTAEATAKAQALLAELRASKLRASEACDLIEAALKEVPDPKEVNVVR